MVAIAWIMTPSVLPRSRWRRMSRKVYACRKRCGLSPQDVWTFAAITRSLERNAIHKGPDELEIILSSVVSNSPTTHIIVSYLLISLNIFKYLKKKEMWTFTAINRTGGESPRPKRLQVAGCAFPWERRFPKSSLDSEKCWWHSKMHDRLE